MKESVSIDIEVNITERLFPFPQKKRDTRAREFGRIPF